METGDNGENQIPHFANMSPVESAQWCKKGPGKGNNNDLLNV
jgi:hypothetical protein